MKVKKLHPNAIIPTKAHETDAGFDLYNLETFQIRKAEKYFSDNELDIDSVNVKTGIAIEFPVGKFGLIASRSSLANRGLIILGGIIDYGYTGEIIIMLSNLANESYTFEKGSKIAQLIILPFFNAKIEIVNELSESERGNRGFGSSDIMESEIAEDFEE
jgi:dUTP pyrophosphatase